MAKTLISTSTASASATLDITSGIDSTYPVYEFHIYNFHSSQVSQGDIPAFRASIDGGSSYGVATTTSVWHSYLRQSDGGSGAVATYVTGQDAAQSAGDIQFGGPSGTDTDQSLSGVIKLYDPSSTTFVKHFIAETNANAWDNPYTEVDYMAGYVNTTSAVDAISFFYTGGNIDEGVIKMYGVS
jgi:hypothetical protein